MGDGWLWVTSEHSGCSGIVNSELMKEQVWISCMSHRLFIETMVLFDYHYLYDVCFLLHNYLYVFIVLFLFIVIILN